MLIIPKAPSSSLTAYYAYTVIVILSLNKIILSLYSRYLKKGLVYIALANLSLYQPSSYLKCTKINIYSSYNVCSVFNAKYTHSITLNSY